jgi:Zn-dependent protease with chaperone function
MFSNFIHFIIVLLIYSTYQPSEDTHPDLYETAFLFLILIVIFWCLTRIQFRRLEKRISEQNPYNLHHKFDTLIARQSVMAIFLFAIDIYGLNLPSFFFDTLFFSKVPVLQALLFIGIFVFYLSIVWACAYEPYQRLYGSNLSRRSYILSNISFSIPVLLPWFFLSGISDIINALPFECPRHFLSTPEGEIIYFLVFLCIVAVIAPALIQRFWKCKPLEDGLERSRIESLCKRAGIEYKNILYWPIFGGRMITAGVMGLVKKFRYILVTGALLQFLEPEEIDAVISHEIGHVKKKHLIWYILFFLGYLLLSYATFDLIAFFLIYTIPIYRLTDIFGLNQNTLLSAVFSLVIILIFVIYFRYIFGYFMRNFERQADTYVYTIFENAKALISTLRKIASTSGQSPDKPNWHHFSIKERIAYLEKCEADKKWITHQDHKIRKSITAYLLVFFLIGGIGYHLNFGDTGKKLNAHFFEKALMRELEKKPDNADLYRMLGDLSYSLKNFQQAIDAYEKSISFEPDNPEVLNNLAWLYATCGDERLRDPQKALMLAKKAAELKNASHILDTLAESYYINDRFEEAVSAEIHAMDMALTDRAYYEGQLKKFLEANKSRK